MSKYDTATPYIAAYALLRRGETVAMVMRTGTDWMNNYYGLPSGKVEQDESFTAAVVREAREEVGITIDPRDASHALTVHRNGAAEDSTYWVDVYFEIRQWDGEVVNAEPDKHSGVEWLDINALPDNVIPSVADALRRIAAGETYSEFGWDT